MDIFVHILSSSEESMSTNKAKNIGKSVCPQCGEIMDRRFDILKEIENLRYQAQHNWRTHFDELAEYQEQIADWLQELVDIHKSQQEHAEFIYKFYEEYMETHQLKQEAK